MACTALVLGTAYIQQSCWWERRIHQRLGCQAYNADRDQIVSCFIEEVKHMSRQKSCTGNCSVFVTTDEPKAT